jgi:mxaD protein
MAERKTADISGSQEAATLLRERHSIKIAASVDRVWAVAGSFADMTWVPVVKRSAATNGDLPGSNRTLDFGGPVLTETLVAYNGPARAYSYAIDDTANNLSVVPVRDLIAQISVAPEADGGSVATWEGSFSRIDQSRNPASGQDDAAARKQVSGTFAAGLAGLKAKVEAGF